MIERLEPRQLLSTVSVAPDSYTVTHDQTLNTGWGGVLQNDWGYDDTYSGSTLTASVVNGPAHGSLSLAANGAFAYTPDAGFAGSDGFTYAASIGGATASASVAITVMNNAPYVYANGTAFLVTHDRTLDLTFPVVHVSDPEGDALTLTVVANAEHGTFDLHADGTFQYTPAAGYTGTDSFSFKYVDSLGAESNTIGFTIDVVNSAPSAYTNVSSFVVTHDQTLNVNFPVFSAYDSDGDALTQTLVSNVAHGTLDLHSDGTFQYTPTAGYTGADSFSFKFVDTIGAESSTLGFTINVVNNAPYAYANGSTSFTVAHDHVLNVTSPVVYTYDPDGDALTQTLVTNVAHGTLDLHSDGTFQYTPATGYAGADSFSFQYVDPLGAETNTIDITIDVVNHAPMASVDSGYVVVNDAVLSASAANGLLVNDTDPDMNDTLTAVLVSGPAYGTLDLHADGSFNYAPSSEYVGYDSFAYQAFDGIAFSAIANVNIARNKVFLDFNGAEVSSTTITQRYLGEGVYLEVRIQGPGQAAMVGVDWTVPGLPVVDGKFPPVNRPGYEIPDFFHYVGMSDDPDDALVSFAWVQPSDALQTVTATVHVQGLPDVTLSTNFDLENPVVGVTVTMNEITSGINKNNMKEIRLGGLSGGPPSGIVINASFSGAAGEFAYLQYDDTRGLAHYQNNPVLPIGGPGDYELTRGGYESLDFDSQFNDRPGLRLTFAGVGEFTHVRYDGSFNTYILWKSDEDNSVWVVTRKVDWQWGFDLETWNPFGQQWTWKDPSNAYRDFQVTDYYGPAPEWNPDETIPVEGNWTGPY